MKINKMNKGYVFLIVSFFMAAAAIFYIFITNGHFNNGFIYSMIGLEIIFGIIAIHFNDNNSADQMSYRLRRHLLKKLL